MHFASTCRATSLTGGRPSIEFEAVLRIFFCENGSESDTLVALASISDWSRVDLAERVAVARGYASGRELFLSEPRSWP